MGITYRQQNESRLTVAQMDDNFHYLEDQLAGLTSSTDRLVSPHQSNSGNYLEVILDNKGTLNTPLLLPTDIWTATCDYSHMTGMYDFDNTGLWEFNFKFEVSQDGIVSTMVDNPFPILTNPGYVSGNSFRFTEADHGIPDFIFDVQLDNVVLAGPAGWTANLAVSQGPEYPSTIKSLGAIKLTSNSNSIILGTDGVLSIPNTIKSLEDITLTSGSNSIILGTDGVLSIPNTIQFPFLPGNQRTGSGDNLQFEKGTHPGSPNQKIISTTDGTESYPTVERLVISGGDSYKNGPTYSGEGGDIYLWAGKGQDGGDIKVDAGNGISSGGTVKVRGGYTETGAGGFVEITAGQSSNGAGGGVQVTAGYGYDGGNVYISSGAGANTGGNLSLNAGNGGTAGGNVTVTTEGVERMKITNDGKIGIGTTPTVALDLVGDMNITGTITSTSTMVLKPDSSLSTDQYIVLDPTEPNHIHIRAGGDIDNSSADLIIGGEDNNLRVSDTTKTVEINSKNSYIQDSASFPSGSTYDAATWSSNLITITNPIGDLVNFINGYVIETDIFTVFYDPIYDPNFSSINILNKDISNYPTIILTVNQFSPAPDLNLTQMYLQINRYQSGRVIADNGTVTVQAGDTVAPKNWVFGTTGSITFPDNSVQSTAYVPKYKVFTALLTQSGTGDKQNWDTSSGIIIGASYFIVDNTDLDVTNIGAPNNNVGTWFIATGTVPTLPGLAGCFYYDPGAPFVTVLENTIGNVWFEFLNDGVYAMRSDGLFTIFKTVGFITYNDGGSTGLDDKPAFSIYPSNDYNIYVNSALNGLLSNNVFAFTSFEIRVYN